MKRNFLRITVIIGLLFLIFSGWLYYREYQSFQIPVHKHADKGIRINVDGIYKTLIWDFISEPWNYSKSGKKKEDKQKPIEPGVEIPANVVLYTLNNQAENTFFGYLKISDHSAFRNFLENKLNVDEFQEISNGVFYTSTKNKLLQIAFTEHELAFACSPFKIKAEVSGVLMDILNRKDILPSSDTLIQRLKQMEGHISFVGETAEGSLDFSEGEISFLGKVKIDSIDIPEQVFHKEFTKESTVKGWLNADISHWLKSMSSPLKENYQLDADSLASYSGGYVNFELIKTVKQIDTAITYTFDDNFEKIAVKTAQEKQVPEIYLTFKNQNQRLVNYLKRQQVLDERLKLNKSVFPLYQFYGSENGDYLQLSTNQNHLKKVGQISSGDFFHLAIDFQQMRKQELFPALNKHILSMDSLNISAKRETTNMAGVKGVLYFNDKDINGLNQVIKLLR